MDSGISVCWISSLQQLLQIRKRILFLSLAIIQGVWLEMSLDGGGVKDELDGLGRVALVVLEPT
jgi:hypothetical protein